MGVFPWGPRTKPRDVVQELRDELLIVRTEHEDEIRDLRVSRDQWRELALEALADLRELRKAVLAPPGEDAVPGVDPKTTREADAERARSLRERQDEEAA